MRPVPSSRRHVRKPRLSGFGSRRALDYDARAIIARMTAAPDAARQKLISDFVAALKAAGVWTKLDVFYVMAANDAQSARLNWKNNATYDLTLVGAPTFTADRGYAGDGVATYLTTGRAQNAALLQDDNALGVWTRSDVASNSQVDVGVASNNIISKNAANALSTRNSTNTSDTVAGGGAGFFMTSRDNSATYERYKNGVALANVTRASVAGSTAAIHVGARNSAGTADLFSTRQNSIVSAGTHLTAGEAAALYAAALAYMQGVGAA